MMFPYTYLLSLTIPSDIDIASTPFGSPITQHLSPIFGSFVVNVKCVKLDIDSFILRIARSPYPATPIIVHSTDLFTLSVVVILAITLLANEVLEPSNTLCATVHI